MSSPLGLHTVYFCMLHSPICQARNGKVASNQHISAKQEQKKGNARAREKTKGGKWGWGEVADQGSGCDEEETEP